MVSAVQAWIRNTVDRAKHNDKAEYLEKGFVIISLFLYFDAVFEITFGAASVIVTRPLFLVSYAIVAYLLFARYRDQLMTLLPKGGLVWALILLPVVSILWSDYPAVTFSSGLAVMQAGLFGTYLGLRFSLKELLHLLAYTLLGLVGLSLLYMVGLPWLGSGPDGETVIRGVFGDANAFGLRMALGAIVFLILALDKRSQRRRASFILFAVTVGCVLLSRSTNARECLIVVLASIPAIAFPRWQKKSFVPAFMYFVSILFGCILFALAKNTGSVSELFNLDSLLRGRIDAEPVVIEAIKQRFWVGYGYQGFWVGGIDSPSETLSQLASVAADTHLHSGILEALLNVGFLGVVCACVCLWSATLNFFLAIRAKRSSHYFFPILFFTLFLFTNFSEQSFYAYRSIFWVLFVSMLVLAIDSGTRQTQSQELSEVKERSLGSQFSTPPPAIAPAAWSPPESGKPQTSDDNLVDDASEEGDSRPKEDVEAPIPQLRGLASTVDRDSPDSGSVGDEIPFDRELTVPEESSRNAPGLPDIIEPDTDNLQSARQPESEDDSETEESLFAPVAIDEEPPSHVAEEEDASESVQQTEVSEDSTISDDVVQAVDAESQPPSAPSEVSEEGSSPVLDSVEVSQTLSDPDLPDPDDELYVQATEFIPLDTTVQAGPSPIHNPTAEEGSNDRASDSEDRPQVEPPPELAPEPELELELEPDSTASIDATSDIDTEPDLEAAPDLSLWTDLVSDLDRYSDEPPIAEQASISPGVSTDESSGVKAAAGARELLLATYWLNSLDPDWIETSDTAAMSDIDPPTEDSPQQSDRPTPPQPSVPIVLVNESMLRVHDLKFEVDSNAPIFRRLEAAELIDAAQLASVQTLWQQEGGLVATILQQETGLGITTLNFFSDTLWPRHLAHRKRIGEYLQEAELVTARDVQSTLDTLHQQQQSIPLGVALAERGLIRQTTADYFARSLVQRAKSIRTTESTGTEQQQLPSNVELTETSGGYSVCVVTLWGRLERRPHQQIRQSLFDAAEQYSPNILVDMSLVTSVDLAALRAIVAAANRCRMLRGQLCLCGLTADVQTFLRNQSQQLGLKSFPNRRIAIEYFPIL